MTNRWISIYHRIRATTLICVGAFLIGVSLFKVAYAEDETFSEVCPESEAQWQAMRARAEEEQKAQLDAKPFIVGFDENHRPYIVGEEDQK